MCELDCATKSKLYSDVIVPVGIAAHDMRLDPEKVRIATEL